MYKIEAWLAKLEKKCQSKHVSGEDVFGLVVFMGLVVMLASLG